MDDSDRQPRWSAGSIGPVMTARESLTALEVGLVLVQAARVFHVKHPQPC
jgi:hypothetical protein